MTLMSIMRTLLDHISESSIISNDSRTMPQVEANSELFQMLDHMMGQIDTPREVPANSHSLLDRIRDTGVPVWTQMMSWNLPSRRLTSRPYPGLFNMSSTHYHSYQCLRRPKTSWKTSPMIQNLSNHLFSTTQGALNSQIVNSQTSSPAEPFMWRAGYPSTRMGCWLEGESQTLGNLPFWVWEALAESQKLPWNCEMHKSSFGVHWTPDLHDRVPKLGCHKSLVQD